MKNNFEIVLLTHADSDLITLVAAKNYLPNDFPNISGLSLQSIHKLESENENDKLKQICLEQYKDTKLFVFRVLGGANSVIGLAEVAQILKDAGKQLIVVSGTGEPSPELACLSSVQPQILQDTISYFQAGGAINFAQLSKYLSDRLLMTGFGYEPPLNQPEHGIYHPDLDTHVSIEEWKKNINPQLPVVGIIFYRAYWLSGNLRFIDALIHVLKLKGIEALAIFTSSLKTLEDGSEIPTAFKYFYDNDKLLVDVLINTTSFAMGDINSGGITEAGWSIDVLSKLNVPVLQAISSSMNFDEWQSSKRGLTPLDSAMNVVMPEFDGRIIAVPFAFKKKHNINGIELTEQTPIKDRVLRIAGIAERYVNLKRLANTKKRIAFVLTNASSKASQIGNAVGLDSLNSVVILLNEMKKRGYQIKDIPNNGDDLIHALIERCNYDNEILTSEQCKQAVGRVSASSYKKWFEELSSLLQNEMIKQWGNLPGSAYVDQNELIVAGLEFGNVIVLLQPPRGWGMDPNIIYHKPDLPPTHHYYAFYKWLESVWKADAIVHVGKHGTLEWLPGKGIGVSQDCYPDALLADMPLFYPFILNDPGEGAQAKRRAHAVVVDHLMPPMTTADTYGLLAQLEQLVAEYYQVEVLDPSRLPLIQQQIWDLVRQANLEYDLKHVLEHELDEDHDHHHEDDHQHDHEHNHDHDHELELDTDKVPEPMKKMQATKISHLVQELDGYLCELGFAQIRNGLHILGNVPKDESLIDTLLSLTRLPNQEIPGLQSSIALCFELTIEELLAKKGSKLSKVPESLQQLTEEKLFTHSDALQAIDLIGKKLYQSLAEYQFSPNYIDNAIKFTFGSLNHLAIAQVKQVLNFACCKVVPDLNACQQEIDNLLNALEGAYVPAGPSGAPTRGMAHILPTGRNFYSVDPKGLPSNSAWQIGQQLASSVLERYLKETGNYPENVSISIWGTSSMRTHGDDVAEVLALLGVKPVWQEENRRVAKLEIIPLEELKRPRIDVTVRISGFFRDAFPNLINLIDQAVNMVVMLDETPEQNYVRKHYLQEVAEASGGDKQEIEHKAKYRIFGSKPGSYGAGILQLINEKNWQDEHDFAEAYVNWGGYAYTENENGIDARNNFRERLTTVEVAIHNQDNREHDIFDSDDYLQFHGGMIATISSLSGRKPRAYFGDSHNPNKAVSRDLNEEAVRVFRTRVVNPKWLESIVKHGYKGGLELAATVDYLFGYDATANTMQDWMYNQLAESYLIDKQMQEFLAKSNPWALHAMADRMLEAAKRSMWENPDPEILNKVKEIYLQSETELEMRGEKQGKTKVGTK